VLAYSVTCARADVDDDGGGSEAERGAEGRRHLGWLEVELARVRLEGGRERRAAWPQWVTPLAGGVHLLELVERVHLVHDARELAHLVSIARVSIARVSIARVSIARVSIARVSIARVSIARVSIATARRVHDAAELAHGVSRAMLSVATAHLARLVPRHKVLLGAFHPQRVAQHAAQHLAGRRLGSVRLVQP
jgi:hypothetical protein